MLQSYKWQAAIMTSSVTSPPAPRSSTLRSLAKPHNVLPAAVWLVLVFNQALLSPLPPSPSTVMLVLINTVAVVLFVIRRDATRVGNKLDLLVALSGTFIISFLKGPEVQDTHWLPSSIQFVALLGWGASLISLGRSFGIVPADRGIVRHGPYRYVRHPVYAFEALFLVGYFIAVPTPRSAVIISVSWLLQVVRILREERILEGYLEYKRQVPWRILPGIW